MIISVYGLLEDMLRSRDSFQQLLLFLSLMNRLSMDEAATTLSTSSFSRSTFNSDSRRVQKVDDYLRAHYIEEITLRDMADLVGMTPVSFSRFFKLRTSTTFSNYLIEMRLGYATRMLVDTTHSIAEIAYQTGFNNLSNFNRLFKKHKHMSPNEFRATYLKNKMLL
jgi:transcriptional regulator GlxA family with amidase domain